MSEAEFTLSLTKEQLVVIKTACEDYLRTRMGQFFDLTNDVAEAGRENVHGVEFDEMIARRNAAQTLMESAFRLAQPVIQSKTERMLIAEDIYDVLKHELWKMRPEEEKEKLGWCVDSNEPLHLSKEPLPIVSANKPV